MPLPLAMSFAGFDPTIVVIWMIAWFAQMGFHEGGHAWTAWWLGDDTAYLLGKRTVNPFKHIDWNNGVSIFNTIGLPLITTVALGFPMGMASVPVGVHHFRRPARDHAIVSFAGPGGGFLVALISLLLFVALFPLIKIPALDLFAMLFQRHVGDIPAGSSKPLLLLGMLLAAIYFAAIIYSVFNLVPIPPLDGSRILYYVGNFRLRQFLHQIEPYGMFIIIVAFWILPGGMLLFPFENALIKLFDWLPRVIWKT